MILKFDLIFSKLSIVTRIHPVTFIEVLEIVSTSKFD